MGFDTYQVAIATLNPNSEQLIKLKPSTIALDQVAFTIKGVSASKIVQQAFANYYKNFPDKPFIEKGFLRHTERTKTEYKWLVEAAIEVYDPGFNKPSKYIKTNVLEVRKSFDNRYIDTLRAYKWYAKQVLKKSKRKVWSLKNVDNITPNIITKAIQYNDNYFTLKGWKKTYFYSLFSTDHNKIRYYKQNNAILDGGLMHKHQFKLDTILLYNNKQVYKIKILPSQPPKRLNRFVDGSGLPFGWIYIRKEDDAILEFKYILIESNRKKGLSESIFSGSNIFSVYDIKFTEYKGRMYPKYMVLTTPKGNRLMDALHNFIYKNKDPEIYYFTREEILFNKIITNKQVIDEAMQQPWDDNLFEPHPYHAKFWKKYNVLLENSEQKKMIKDLEKKVKLKEQFKADN